MKIKKVLELGLFDLAMNRTPAEEGIVFLLLHNFCLQLLVTGAQIAGRWFSFFTCFSTL